MPIYEYQCDACGHQLEVMQKVSDAPLKTCPACEKRKLKKQISMTSFRLKGGGWYATDFAKSSSNKESEVEKPCIPEKCEKTDCPNRQAADKLTP